MIVAEEFRPLLQAIYKRKLARTQLAGYLVGAAYNLVPMVKSTAIANAA